MSVATDEIGRTIVSYVPSQSAFHALDAAAKGWGSAVVKRQGKAIRKSVGAVFRLPLEDGSGTIEAFITDWSPFPAACAVAVHRDHPLACAAGRPEGTSFLGQFVRHPLTGDLLPIWVAPFVLPEFGTGAVIVNPAHSAADLKVAREIGLPVRFGLAPASITGDPASWPEPPVIKSGVTVRTGAHDGIPVLQAVEAYFAELAEYGHADKVTSYGAGKHELAVFTPTPEGGVSFDSQSLTWVDGGKYGERGALESSLLLAASQLAASDHPSIVTASSAIETDLLFLRLLFFDLYGRALEPDRVQVVQNAVAPKGVTTDELPLETLRLALVASAEPAEPASLKAPIVEQAERFVAVHQELVQFSGGEAGEPAEHFEKLSRVTIEALGRGNLKTAFGHLYKLQKALKALSAEERVESGAMPAYLALSFALAGLEGPASAAVALRGFKVFGGGRRVVNCYSHANLRTTIYRSEGNSRCHFRNRGGSGRPESTGRRLARSSDPEAPSLAVYVGQIPKAGKNRHRTLHSVLSDRRDPSLDRYLRGRPFDHWRYAQGRGVELSAARR